MHCRNFSNSALNLTIEASAEVQGVLGERKNICAYAAKCFFKKALRNNEKPIKINVDKSGANKSALDGINKDYKEEEQIEIRQNKYLNNLVEQDHRFVKKRVKPMLGFKSFWSAKKTIAGIEVVHMIKKGQLNSKESGVSTFDQFVSLAA